MTKNSFICNFINENPNNWRELISEMGIMVKDDPSPLNPYSIFNYGIGADFTNPIVQEARGIIIDTEKLEVVCWPFRKFGKYNESYADEIDWNTARVQEKIDGSIIKLWYDHRGGGWNFSTNGMIDARNAYCDEDHKITFLDLIRSTDTYGILHHFMIMKDGYGLNRHLTYIFELVTPNNQVVIKHTCNTMYHIGTRNNITGEELIFDIPNVKKPMEFPINNLEGCIDAVEFHNINHDTGKISMCDFEGFVVVDANWNRIKVKSPIYSILHNILNNGDVSKMKLVEIIDKDMIDIGSIASDFTDRGHWLYYYGYKYTEVMYQMNSFLNIIRKIYNENGKDRKDIAMRIKKHKYSPIAFKGLDNDLTVKEILDKFTGGYLKNLCKYIPNYEPENYGYLFETKE